MDLKQKVWKGAMAGGILLGAAGLLVSQAFADSPSAASSQGSGTHSSAPANGWHGGRFGGPGGMGMRMGFAGGGIVQESATILNLDAKTLMSDLQQGQTLAEVAQAQGMGESDLISKLQAAETSNIQAAVKAGKMTQTQADQVISALPDKLKAAVERQGLGHGPGRGRGPGRMGGPGGLVDKASIAQLLGISQSELQSDLQSGESLAEIAQSKGISEDQLITDLKDSMTNRLKTLVERKGFGKPAAQSSSSASGASQSQADSTISG